MPRARKAVIDDPDLGAMESLDGDPAPAATRRGPGRPRKTAVKAAGNRGQIPTRTSGGRIMSKAAMQSKVAGEIYAYVSMAAAGWELRDPECAGILYETVTIPGPGGPVQVERLQAIVDRIVAMISRSDDLLKRFADSGILGELAVLGTLMFPLAAGLWKAHGPAGNGHGPAGEGAYDADRYPAYAPVN